MNKIMRNEHKNKNNSHQYNDNQYLFLPSLTIKHIHVFS